MEVNKKMVKWNHSFPFMMLCAVTGIIVLCVFGSLLCAVYKYIMVM